MLYAFDRGRLDAAIVRREPHRRGGETLLEDEFAWFAAPAFRQRGGEKLRMAMLAAPCGVRALAIRALDKKKRPWVEAFTGGGVAAISAAVLAGLAVAPLARRIAPAGAVDVSATFSLPALGRSAVNCTPAFQIRVQRRRCARCPRRLGASHRKQNEPMPSAVPRMLRRAGANSSRHR